MVHSCEREMVEGDGLGRGGVRSSILSVSLKSPASMNGS